MIRVYGHRECPHCTAAKEKLKAAGIEFEFIDIAASTRETKEFLKFRDTHPEAFEEARKNDKIGIPCFVLDDGTITRDLSKIIK